MYGLLWCTPQQSMLHYMTRSKNGHKTNIPGAPSIHKQLVLIRHPSEVLLWKLMIWFYVLCPDRILTKRYLAALGIFNTVVVSHQTAPRLLDFQISVHSAVEVWVYGFLHNGFLLCKFGKVIFEGFLHTQHRIAKFLQRWRLSGYCKDLLICRFSWFYGRIKT